MQFHSHANLSHFHKNGFALRLALKQRHKGTRKWLIDFLMVIMASDIARGRVRTTATATTVESRKMVAILQIIG